MSVDQPPPIPNRRRPVWELVVDDMHERDRIGTARYGTPLQPFNGRDPLVDAYQEALDLVVYLRQAIEERAERRLQASLGTVDQSLVERLAQGLCDAEGHGMRRSPYPLSDFQQSYADSFRETARRLIAEVD